MDAASLVECLKLCRSFRSVEIPAFQGTNILGKLRVANMNIHWTRSFLTTRDQNWFLKVISVCGFWISRPNTLELPQGQNQETKTYEHLQNFISDIPHRQSIHAHESWVGSDITGPREAMFAIRLSGNVNIWNRTKITFCLLFEGSIDFAIRSHISW